MKKLGFLFLAMALMAVGLTGCSGLLEIDDPVEATGMEVYLGGEDVYLDISSVKVNDVEQLASNFTVGTANPTDGSLAWTDYASFYHTEGLSLTDDWEIVYTAHVQTPADVNWNNWIMYIKNMGTDEEWALRADAWTNTGTLSNYDCVQANVTYTYTWEWADFLTVFADTDVVFTVTKDSDALTVKAEIGGTVVYTAVADAI